MTLSSASYYLERREVLVDRAWALYRQPGLEALEDALAGEQQVAALARLREAAATPGLLDTMKPVERAKLDALLRDPAAFVPCRSLVRSYPNHRRPAFLASASVWTMRERLFA